LSRNFPADFNERLPPQASRLQQPAGGHRYGCAGRGLQLCTRPVHL